MTEIYSASDYAGLKGGAYSFYYGYERTNVDEEWLFTASVGGEEVASWTATQLGIEQFDKPTNILMMGIARFLEEISESEPT